SPMPVPHSGLDKERFTRVNFRPREQILFSTNYLDDPSLIPLGTPARVTFYSSSEIHVLLEGVEYTLYPSKDSSFDTPAFPTDEARIETFLKKYFVDRKEDIQLDSLGPPDFNDEVLSGIQRIGMTKEQTYACLGPPIQIDRGLPTLSMPYERILVSDRWIYP